MANNPSAEKRHRQNLKRRESNRIAKAALRTEIKSALRSAKTGEREQALAHAKKATSLLDKAAIHGVMKKNTVQRTISRLHRRINALGQEA